MGFCSGALSQASSSGKYVFLDIEIGIYRPSGLSGFMIQPRERRNGIREAREGVGVLNGRRSVV